MNDAEIEQIHTRAAHRPPPGKPSPGAIAGHCDACHTLILLTQPATGEPLADVHEIAYRLNRAGWIYTWSTVLCPRCTYRPDPAGRYTSPTPLFHPGRLVATPGALELLATRGFADNGIRLLNRHLHGDYGDLCRADWEENKRSLKHGWRLLSRYDLGPAAPRADAIWIITEADRSATTLLLPAEY